MQDGVRLRRGMWLRSPGIRLKLIVRGRRPRRVSKMIHSLPAVAGCSAPRWASAETGWVRGNAPVEFLAVRHPDLSHESFFYFLVSRRLASRPLPPRKVIRILREIAGDAGRDQRAAIPGGAGVLKEIGRSQDYATRQERIPRCFRKKPWRPNPLM